MKEKTLKQLFYGITVISVLLPFILTSCKEEDKPKDTSFYGKYTDGKSYVNINEGIIEVYLAGKRDSILDRGGDMFDYYYTYENIFLSYNSIEEDESYKKSYTVYPTSGTVTAYGYYHEWNWTFYDQEDLGFGTFSINDNINSIALNIIEEEKGSKQYKLEVQGQVDSLLYNLVLYKCMEENNPVPANKILFAKTFDKHNYSINETVLDLTVQVQNHTLVINNNKNTNGGYNFVHYEWYRVDSNGDTLLMSNNDLGYYYTGGSDKDLDTSSYYYAVLYADNNNLYYTKPFRPYILMPK